MKKLLSVFLLVARIEFSWAMDTIEKRLASLQVSDQRRGSGHVVEDTQTGFSRGYQHRSPEDFPIPRLQQSLTILENLKQYEKTGIYPNGFDKAAIPQLREDSIASFKQAVNEMPDLLAMPILGDDTPLHIIFNLQDKELMKFIEDILAKNK